MSRIRADIEGEFHERRVRGFRFEGAVTGRVAREGYDDIAVVEVGTPDGTHPDLPAHEQLGLAADHDHPFAADDHSHPGGDHPDAAAHEQMGLAADDHSHPAPDLTHDHDADYAPIHPHPYSAEDHSHPGGGEHPDLAAHETLGLAAEVHAHDDYATDADLTTHAGTAHGLSAHAIDGAYHSGTELLPTQGQKNALTGTSGTPGVTNQYVTHQDARLSDERTPTAHTHDYADADHGHSLTEPDIPAAIARDAEVTAAIASHAATPHGGDSSEVYAVGDVYITKRQGDPATLLGYGTWEQVPEGTFVIAAGATIAAGSTGGAATHTHADHTDVPDHTHVATVTDPQHAHVQGVNSATTGGTSGYTPDTSTNTRVNSGYSTSTAATGITVANASPAGAVSALAHDSPTHLPPYRAYFVWERIA